MMLIGDFDWRFAIYDLAVNAIVIPAKKEHAVQIAVRQSLLCL